MVGGHEAESEENTRSNNYNGTESLSSLCDAMEFSASGVSVKKCNLIDVIQGGRCCSVVVSYEEKILCCVSKIHKYPWYFLLHTNKTAVALLQKRPAWCIIVIIILGHLVHTWLAGWRAESAVHAAAASNLPGPIIVRA